MISENSLVIYKNKPAIVKERADGKFSIVLADGERIKVRDKDIELIHPGHVKDFKSIEDAFISEDAIREAWELLSEEGASLSLKELTNFIFNDYTPSCAYAAFCLLRSGLYFSGTIDEITPRSKDDVTAEELKRCGKQRETGERSLFLDRLKKCLKNPAANTMLPDDLRFMQDAEALSYGKSAKSRTLRDIGLGETPEDAHSVLLKTGFWTAMINPHPGRYGLSVNSASVSIEPPPAQEYRRDLSRLVSFAIDSPWCDDPDDALSVEIENAGFYSLYVHVADPASSVKFDSPAEKEARDRGATLYLPEGAVRMLAEESIPMFALGLSGKSCALTFKLTIDKNGEVTGTEIFPSVVKVRRITYEEADREIDGDCEDAAVLRALLELSRKIYNRRTANGAVNIELPDVHITVENEKVKIEPICDYRSSFIVKECMIAAGEGAGTWAASKGLAFPYISQEVELQGKVPGGFAGSMQLRKCMRPRVLSVKPGCHQGLGLDTYTQVTSPLRRYTDLLAHIQIRAFLGGGKILSADEISARLGFSEAASAAAVHAERASDNHWKMVYLQQSIRNMSDKKDSFWEAVAIESKGNRWLVLIPSLALETQVALQKNVAPNDIVRLILKSVNIAKGEAVFLHSQN
ncbi:MAG: ribonuclease catalytic domain-containing protein [Treponema sp.]|nr:ribonuclease catalytic domain-containing protein [Treponema sp.]